MTKERMKLFDWLAFAFWWAVVGAAAVSVFTCLHGCAPAEFDGLSEGDEQKHDGRDPDALELEPDADAGDAGDVRPPVDAGTPDAAPAKPDAAPPVPDAAAPPDAAPPATLAGTWTVTPTLDGAGCTLGALGALEWRVRPGAAIEQPPPENALVWQEGAYQAASGGWVVRVELALDGAELVGTLERRAPPQCALERYRLRGVRP